MNIFLKFLFTLTIFFHFSGLSIESPEDIKAFKEAEGLFAQVEDSNDAKEKGKKIHSVINKLLQIKSIKDNQDNSYEPINKEYASLLFKSAGRLLQLDHVGQPLCMLCFKKSGAERNMANSHYVSKSLLKSISNHWNIPGNKTKFSTEKMTLRLLCKGKEKLKNSGCEELLSQKGENSFSEHFLPFINEVVNYQSGNKVGNEPHLNYGPWLFHTIASLAYRVFLSDLENHENWLSKLDTDDCYKGAEDSLWAFFFNLRQFILQPNIVPNFCIKLYLSADGIAENNELPLSHSIGSAKEENGSAWYHWVHFSLKGFHFLVLSATAVPLALDPSFKLQPKEFLHELTSVEGGIFITKDAVFSLPEIVKGAVKFYRDDLIKKFGGMPLPELIVSLPDAKYFSDVEYLSTYTPSDSKNVVWLFEHREAKYHFVIIQFPTTNGIDEGIAVLGWKFDMLAMKEPMERTIGNLFDNSDNVDYSPITKLLEPLFNNDHTDMAIDKDGVANLVFFTLFSYFNTLDLK